MQQKPQETDTERLSKVPIVTELLEWARYDLHPGKETIRVPWGPLSNLQSLLYTREYTGLSDQGPHFLA